MTSTTAHQIDPVTLEVLSTALPAVANEMSLDLQRSSYNMMIYEVGDYSCALLTATGDLVAQNMGGVSHFVSDLGTVIRDGVARYGHDGFNPGDVIVTNHQGVAGQHLNNIVVYTPIFVDATLWGFSAIRAHWMDVGGMSTGFGGSRLSHDAWAEGLQIDQIKVWDGGERDEKVLRLILDNVRFPEASLGDLRSQVAACHLAGRRVAELHRRYGSEVVEAAILTMFRQTEERCRNAVESIPDGVYEAASFLDGDDTDPEPIEIHVKVSVSGSEMEIDLSRCSSQRRSGVNGRTFAGAFVAYKALTAPRDPVNEGSFAAATVIIPEGNIMMAHHPAPMAGWSVVLPTVVDTVFRALADAMPERIAAGHYGTLGIPVVFFGTNPRNGRRFVSQSIEGGGWGGRPSGDGPSASMSVCQGDVRNGPIENIELKVPLLVEERALIEDSGGAGTFRGGLGERIRLRTLAEGRWNLNQSRRKSLPGWGLQGGRPGGTADNLMKLPGEAEFTSVDAVHVLTPPDTIVIQMSGGGGGWGDPLAREPERVLDDVQQGYVSADSALRHYGVVFTEDRTGVDYAATASERAGRQGGAPSQQTSQS